MKNKHGKVFRGPRPENIDLEGQSEFPESSTNSWLTETMGLDKKTQVNQVRSIASELFLQTKLFPLIKKHETVDEAKLVNLLIDFKKSSANVNMGFEMAHVTAHMLRRFQCYLIDDADDASSPSEPLAQEIELFDALSKLNFKRIDEEVRYRLYSG